MSRYSQFVPLHQRNIYTYMYTKNTYVCMYMQRRWQKQRHLEDNAIVMKQSGWQTKRTKQLKKNEINDFLNQKRIVQKNKKERKSLIQNYLLQSIIENIENINHLISTQIYTYKNHKNVKNINVFVYVFEVQIIFVFSPDIFSYFLVVSICCDSVICICSYIIYNIYFSFYFSFFNLFICFSLFLYF